MTPNLILQPNAGESGGESYAELMAWVRSHRAQVEQEAQADAAAGLTNSPAILLQTADMVYEHVSNARTQAALMGAVSRYREAKTK